MVARRTSSGAGFVVGARPDGVGGVFKRADMYAKLPRELAEGSVLGGVLSVVFLCVFVLLFAAQLRELWGVTTVTDVLVDHSDDDTFQVNLKLELPALSCEWATIDVIDALGTRHFNISGEGIYKHSAGATKYLGVEHGASGGSASQARLRHALLLRFFSPSRAAHPVIDIENQKTLLQAEPEYGESTDIDHYGNARIAYEVTGATFERMVRAHQVLLVNFHAPWCAHCQKTAPIFEHAAELVRDDLRAAGRPRLAAALATVDCTLDGNKDLCRDQHIQAFPTMRVYRAGSLHPTSGTVQGGTLAPSGGAAAAAADAAESDLSTVLDVPKPLQFEVYHGRRDAEDIASFVRKVLVEVLATKDDGEGEGALDAAAARRRASETRTVAAAQRALGGQARAVRPFLFFTRRSVSTFDRVPFHRLTDERTIFAWTRPVIRFARAAASSRAASA